MLRGRDNIKSSGLFYFAFFSTCIMNGEDITCEKRRLYFRVSDWAASTVRAWGRSRSIFWRKEPAYGVKRDGEVPNRPFFFFFHFARLRETLAKGVRMNVAIEQVKRSKREKLNDCLEFFYKLADLLDGDYELVESCNADISSYLVPRGTAGDISYYGKPKLSFRVSDHWNWYSNLKKCDKPGYVQCLSTDVPRARKRPEEGEASKPRIAIQVSLVGDDGKYHAVYGEKYDWYYKDWVWVDADPNDIAQLVYA